MLLETGKMDEKQVPVCVFVLLVLCSRVDCEDGTQRCSLLSVLAADFLVSTQELFRCTDHTPLRPFYLWYI